MKFGLDFRDCLKDSPKFRTGLEEHERSMYDLEHHLEKLVKVSSQVVDAGKMFNQAISVLINNFDAMATLFYNDEFVSSSLKKLNTVLGSLQTYLTVFLEQTQKSITFSINHFIKEEIKKVKETKKVFDKVSVDLDNARVRNSQLVKTIKHSDSEEAENVLTATQSCFNHTSLDYTFMINSLESKKRFYILSQIMMFLNGAFTYHQQSCEVLTKFEDNQKDISHKLEEMQTDYLSEQKEMDERHDLVQIIDEQYDDLLNQTLPSAKNSVIFDGYLFKRASNAFKTWNRRWFVIKNNNLFYTRRSKSESVTEMVDLRLSTVKHAEDVDRRFTFAVVCPTKCWYLQADNSKLKERWMTVMQMAIAKALNDGDGEYEDDTSPNTFKKLHPQYLLTQIRELPGNDTCVDCVSNKPKWASINLGIILCIECSGIHRSLGVHVSKVRSITLDDWDAESIKVMLELGNDVINNIYEAELDSSWLKPIPSSNRTEKEKWIHAKYVEKKFISKIKSGTVRNGQKLKRRNIVKKGSDGRLRSYSIEKINLIDMPSTSPQVIKKTMSSVSEKKKVTPTNSSNSNETESDEESEEPTSLHPNMLLYQSAKSKNISMMALAIANGADVNWRNYTNEQRTCLHESVLSGSVSASEYLLQNGAMINIEDEKGRTGLHLAALFGSTGHTCLFLKRDANQNSADRNGQDPLSIALQKTHADIVTLLRLARLHEEIKETDISMGGDETVTNVFRDFSQMASQNPEKLKRDRHTDV